MPTLAGHSGPAQLRAAVLEALLDGDADAFDHHACLVAQLDQPLHRLAIGEEIINEQHMLAGVQEALGHDDREFALLGERVHLRDILVAVKIDGLRFLGEHDRHVAEMTRRDTGDADA